ncbi:hypothetical protein M434DRAFT_13813 [Hypoxylon sp. CO27-5]|nr:hypothetical protein M434DRAFT_13813 [Hypoxylon sp. CO27-5]
MYWNGSRESQIKAQLEVYVSFEYLHLSPRFLALPFDPSIVHRDRDWEIDGIQSWSVRGTDCQRAGISFNRYTKIVSGILIVDEGCKIDDDQWIYQIKESRACAIHPLLIPTLLASNYIRENHERSGGIFGRLGDLERLAGVRSFSNPSVQAFIKDSYKRIREAADLRAEISDFTTALFWLKGCVFGPTRECIRIFQNSLVRSHLETCMGRNIYLVGKELDERMEFIERGEIWLSAMAKGYVAKADTTISGLYAMFALRDNENNLEIASRASKTAEDAATIAEETKRDSSTMTSIAALSMVFLPGTFVATVLAMPMVAWTPEDFWKYWAITLPLTVAIIVSWQIWAQCKIAGRGRRFKQFIKRRNPSQLVGAI